MYRSDKYSVMCKVNLAVLVQQDLEGHEHLH